MPDRITKTQRWLDLIAYLLGRRVPVPVEEIMRRLPAYAEKWTTDDPTAQASARRMFERDKDELKQLGIPIEIPEPDPYSSAETSEGYRIDRKRYYLPYLRLLSEHRSAEATAPTGKREVLLEEDEARLATHALQRMAQLPAFPFADEARSALRKLGFDLDLERFTSEHVLWVERPGAREVLGALEKLSAALLAKKRVRFRYAGIYRGETTERDVAPYGLFFQRDWYLVGEDASRGAVRVFRVARMEEIAVNPKSPKHPDYELPAEFQLQDYLRRDAWELSGTEGEESVTAELLFHFPLSVWAERAGQGELALEREDGSAVRRFPVHQAGPFLRWVLTLQGKAEILSPPALQSELNALASSVLALYAEDAV